MARTAGQVLKMCLKPRGSFLFLSTLIALGISLQTVRAGDNGWSTRSLQGLNVGTFAIDPSSPTTLYALAPNAILRSIDGGGEWSMYRPYELGSAGPGQFAVDPLSSDIFYAASDGGLFRSLDAGLSWEQLAPGLLTDVRWLAVDNANPNNIWAIMGSDTLRTQDGGKSWASAGVPVKGYTTGFAQAGNTVYLAVERQGLFRSDDGGKTWVVVGSGLPESANLWDLAVDPQSGSVYLNSDSGPYRSLDRGSLWESIAPEGYWSNARLEAFGGGRLLMLTGDRQATSDSGGREWQVREQSSVGETRQLGRDPQTAGVVYALSNAGLSKSFDYGANWRAPETAPEGIVLLATHPTRTERLYGRTYNSILRSDDAGVTWQLDRTFAENRSLTAMSWAPGNSNVGYASYGQGLLRSDDSGDTTWKATLLPEATQVTAIHISPHDPNAVFVLSNGRALTSTSSGQAWGELPLPPDVRISDLGLSYQNPNAIYAISGNALYYSSDGSADWTVRPVDFGSIAQLQVDPLDDQHLAALANGSIFVSRDGGQHWKAAVGLPEGGAIQGMRVQPSEPTLLYAFDYQQVYLSPNAGETWLPLGQPVPGNVANMTAGGSDPRYILVQTNNGAVWRYHFSGLPPTPTPTPTSTPTVTPTPRPTATNTPTPRPQLTIVPAATPVNLDPPRRPSQGGSGFPLWLLGVLALLLGGAAAGYFMFRRQSARQSTPPPPPFPPTPPRPGPAVQSVTCSKGHTSPASARFCQTCGERLHS